MHGDEPHRSETSTRTRLARELALIITISGLVSVAFCRKAFHIDDPLYLSIARQILIDPWQPFDGLINWQQVTEPAWKVSISPPGYSYWLAGWMALGITSEVGLHLVGTIWIVLLGVSTYAWSRRLCRWPATAALLVVTGPLVAAGQNLMLDVPMLALSSAAVALYLHAADRHSVWWAVAAGVLAGLAVNVKYAGVMAIVVMGIDAVLWRRWSMLAAAAVASGLLVAGQLLTAVDGTPQLFRASDWISRLWPSDGRDKLHRISTSMIYLGSSAAWIILLAGWLFRRGSSSVGVMMAAAFGASASVLDLRALEPDLTVSASAFAFVFSLGGWLVSIWVLVQAVVAMRHAWPWRREAKNESDARLACDDPRRHGLLLFVWTSGFWYLGVLNGPFVAPRALAPCVLGLVLIVGLLSSKVVEIASPVRVGAVAATCLIGGLVGLGDYQWAGIYRDWAPRLAQQYAARSGQTYFLGHWGWQYYAERAGMIPFDPVRSRLAPGDVLVIPTNVDLQPLPRSVALGCDEIAREPVTLTCALPRTRYLPAFIFLHGDTRHGRIPWGWSTAKQPIETFLILRYRGA